MASSSDEIKKTKNHYERRIKVFASANDDADSVAGAVSTVGAEPLEFWWRYILWAQKQGTPKFVEDLCKRCVECFNEKPSLMRDVDAETDERYAKIWLKIANTSTDDPSAIYKHMYKSKIATKLSLFYVNWATHSNQSDNKEFAVKILKSALKKNNVEPRQTLLDSLAELAPDAEKNEKIVATTTAEAQPSPHHHHQQPRQPSVQQFYQPSPQNPPNVAPASSMSGNSVAKYRKSEVYPHGDVDVAPNGWEQSLEEIRSRKWRRERERISSAHSARAAELEERLRDADARLREAESRAEKERKERERLTANVAELEKTMAGHVEELMKNFEEQMAAKDEEIQKLVSKLAAVEEELAAATAAIAEARKGSSTSSTEKRDHASALLTPKGPAAKRQSYGFGATVMPSPTINSKMAQAQVLALFNQTMKFGASEPSIGSGDPSSIDVNEVPPTLVKPAAPAFQIFQDDDDANKENAARSSTTAAPPPAPFAIFKDPTEKITVPKNAAAGAKLSGILKATTTTPAVLAENTGGENIFDHHAAAAAISQIRNDKTPSSLRQQHHQQQQQPEIREAVMEDNFGDITSFNPPESSTVNVASILKSQGVKSARQLYHQHPEPTVKFSVPTKQLLRKAQRDDEHVATDGVDGDPFGGVTEFVPPSCSTTNWQALAKVAQKNLDESSTVGLDGSARIERPQQPQQPQLPHQLPLQQRRQQSDPPRGRDSAAQQPPPPPPPPPPPISQGLLDVADDENPHENPRPMSPIYEVSKEFSQISVGSNRTRCSSSSSSSSSSALTTLSKSGGGCLSHHSTRGGRFADMENLQEEDEEEEAQQREHHHRQLETPAVAALPTPGGLGRLNKTDAHTTMNADERSHALLPPTTPGAAPRPSPPYAARLSSFQPFVDEPSLPSRSLGVRSELPLPMDDFPMDMPEPMDDLDDLMGRQREEDAEEEQREVPRNDLSCLFESPATMEDSERNAEDTTDVAGGGVVFDPMMMETHARDYDAATFNLNQTVAIEDKVPEHECTIMIDPEDPWKPKLIQSFLRKAAVPLPEREGYVELSPDCEVTTALKVGKSYELGVGDSFLVQKQIGEGGFGRIFLAEWTTSTTGTASSPLRDDERRRRLVCLKFQKPPCPWEFYVSSEIHRRLRASEGGRQDFMKIERAYFSEFSSIFVNSVGKGTLLDVVNAFKTCGTVVGEELAMLLSLEMLRVVDRLHSCQIIHADVKPDNFLFCGPLPEPAALKADLSARRPLGETPTNVTTPRRSLVKLIDFGRCIDMTLFRDGTNFLAKVKTDGYQCQEMIEGKPWTYQIDLFGLLASIFVLLRGEYPRWKRQTLGKALFPPLGIGSGGLRSFVHRELWNELVSTLVGIPDCDSIPPLAPLMRKLRDALWKDLDGYERKYKTYVEVLKKAQLV